MGYPAVVDTGSPPTVVPRFIAEKVGLYGTGDPAAIELMGKTLDGRATRATIEFENPDCHAETEIFVPDDGTERSFLLGMEFLQAAGCRINTRAGDEKVVCKPRGCAFDLVSVPETLVYKTRRK